MRGELGHSKMPVLPVGLAERDLLGECAILCGGGEAGWGCGNVVRGWLKGSWAQQCCWQGGEVLL
jgi:hypothetical protein